MSHNIRTLFSWRLYLPMWGNPGCLAGEDRHSTLSGTQWQPRDRDRSGVPSPNRAQRKTSVVLAGLLALVGLAPASAQTLFPNVPEFYQHQYWVKPGDAAFPGFPNWETTGGWCWQTAVVDALYKWSVYQAPGGGMPYSTLIYPGISANATWLRTASTGIQRFANLGDSTVNGLLNNTTAGVLNPAGTDVGPNAAQGAAPRASLTNMSYVVDQNTGAVKVYLAGKAAPERVKQAGANPGPGDANSTAFQTYQGLMQASRSTVLTIFNTAAYQNGLWWAFGGTGGGHFHALAGAGYGGAGQIYYADPDVVPPNAGNQNGGWVGTGLMGPLPDPLPDAQRDAIFNNAQAAVNANRYAANAAGPPIGAAYYGNLTVNGTGRITSSVATTTLANGNYAGTRLGGIDAIAPTDIGLVSSIDQGNGTWRDTFRVIGDVSGDISQIDILPVVPLAAAPGFAFTKANWNASAILTDPYQGEWAGGGENIGVGAGGVDMTAGEVQTDTMLTTEQVTQFNVFEYDNTLHQWDVQAYGATGNAFGYQADAVTPERGSLLLLLPGLAGVGVSIVRRRRLWH